MNQNFYKEFEDRFRGSREDIKERLKVYLPFLEPLKKIYPTVQAVDLGCGRGEWLEILGESGFKAQGVDLDDGMLEYCKGISLDVDKVDALSFLKNLASESKAVITGFQLIEHLPFDNLFLLVEESLRVLKPGGILILETPNPENVVVGSSLFYTDPTHYKPIPLELLQFLVEKSGFGKVKSLRLQEPDGGEQLSLLSVFNGVSPDYAIVAQKQAETTALELFAEPFAKDYGFNLEDIVARYDLGLLGHVNETLNPVMQKTNNIEIELKRLETEKINNIEIELKRLETEKINNIEIELKRLETEKKELEVEKNEIKNELADIQMSRSWRCTKPIRELANCLRRLRNKEKNMSIQPFKKIIARLPGKMIRSILSHEQLRSKLILILNHYPRTKFRIKTMMINSGLSASVYTPVTKTNDKVISPERNNSSSNFKDDSTLIQIRTAKGINVEKKSPLEKWFS